MSVSNVYFDFDDVVTDLYTVVKEAVRFIHNFDAPPTLNLYQLNEQEEYGGSIDHGDIPIVDSDVYKIIYTVMTGNVNLLPMLKDADDFFDSFIIKSAYKPIGRFVFKGLTARNPLLSGVIDDWMRVNLKDRVPYKVLHASGNQGGTSNSKPEVLKELKATHYVEDQYCVASKIVDSGIPVFLLDKPYNQGFPEREGITRIENLCDIKKHIKLN